MSHFLSSNFTLNAMPFHSSYRSILWFVDATVTARAAAAGIVNSIWDLGSALLSSNGYATGDRRLRSGSNLSESSVTSNSNSDRGDRGEDRSPGGFDPRSKHQSTTNGNGKVMTTDKDKVQGSSATIERDAECVKRERERERERGCEGASSSSSASKGRLEFAHRNPLSVAHTVVPSTRVSVGAAGAGADAGAPSADLLKGFSEYSDSKGCPVSDPMSQCQQQLQWGGAVNGHFSTTESSVSSSSSYCSASSNTQAPFDDMGGQYQHGSHGLVRGSHSHRDYRAECPIASTFNITQTPTPAGGEPLDSLEGSLQQLLKMLGAAGCVGESVGNYVHIATIMCACPAAMRCTRILPTSLPCVALPCLALPS